jgi:dTDP-glucose 4,6-dehydratase
MKLLVTGGAGFIGCNLIREVIRREEIKLLVNLDALTYAGSIRNNRDVADDPKYRFAQVDLRDAKKVAEVFREYEPTHVMHLAAESHVDRSILAPDDFIQSNIVGTFNLLEAARRFWKDTPGAHLFLHVSTDEVFGSLGAEGVFSEMSPYTPNSPYSASKAASDFLVRSYFHTYGLPVITTNCSNNYGPHQFREKLIPVMIHSLMQRKPLPVYGDGLNVRDWLHVKDHVSALWTVLGAGKIGETYCIGGNNEIANIRLVEKLCDFVDEMKPEWGGNSQRLITFVKDRPGHDRRYAISTKKIANELKWIPEIGLKEGLKSTVKWYLANAEWFNELKS